MTHPPTPTKPHAVTLHLRDDQTGQVIGSCSIRLVLVDDHNPATDTFPGFWAITHTLGSVANGTYTEVAFVDGTLGRRDLDGDGSFRDPVRDEQADRLVRQIANTVYPQAWAFHYRPERVADAVLAHRLRLRERIEVSEVEVWEA
jgi:hypothetical protein